MPIRIPLHTIILVRDGKRVVPAIGKPFDFTSDELKSIKEVSETAVRVPVNESPNASSEPVKTTPPAGSGAKNSGAKNSGAKNNAKGAEANASTGEAGGKSTEDSEGL